jgi:hypothetical protein
MKILSVYSVGGGYMNERETGEVLADHENRLSFLEALHTESNAHLFQQQTSDLYKHLGDFTDILEGEMVYSTELLNSIRKISLFVKQLSGRLVELEQRYSNKRSKIKYK